MRQRRQRLQVSTFPFLAVLLCAMGSLILLLLVIDRRAKVVARAKALRLVDQAALQAAALEEKAAAAHRAEWERRRQTLHEQLLQQDGQVVRDLQAVQNQAVAATANVQTELARRQEVKQQLQIEHSGLDQLEAELTTRRAELAKSVQQTDASRTEWARLTAELERMEHTLADVRAARQRQQQMYSLVPYRGKRGDNRRPVYIECNGNELIFHPDRLALHGPTLTPSRIRDEIERRLTQRRSETKAVSDKGEENAYLLMLIRPNGITTYYQILAALKGVKSDFGYEFIDQDWLLNFSENDAAPKAQPWMAAEQPNEKRTVATSAQTVGARGPSISGRPRGGQEGLLSGGTVPARPVGIVASGSPGHGYPPFGVAATNANGEGSPSAPGATNGNGERNPGALGATNGNGEGNPGALGATNGNGEGNSGALGPNHANGQANPGGLVTGKSTTGDPPVAAPPGVSGPPFGLGEANAPSFAQLVPGGSQAPSAAPSSQNSTATTAPGQRPGGRGELSGAADGPDIGPAIAVAQGGMTDQTSDIRITQSQGSGKADVQGTSGGTGNQGMNTGNQAIEASPSPLPSLAPNRANAPANPSVDTAQRGPMEGTAGGILAPGQPPSGEPASGTAGSPLDRLTIQNSTNKTVRAVPLRPGLLNGNRDWIIPIECTAEAVVLHPSGQRIDPAELSRGANGKSALFEAVQQMIVRRQSTVRAGEPPYRPMIRFRVRPDGLRSYYLAYPALETLHVPMSRENLEPEEKKAGGER